MPAKHCAVVGDFCSDDRGTSFGTSGSVMTSSEESEADRRDLQMIELI